MRKITGIILHCSATRPEWMDDHGTQTKVEEIRKWHKDRGWSDIGYHYLIDRDGAQATGRSVTRTGAHVRGHNTGTIGVCLIGGHGASANDSFGEHFTPEQATALRRLLNNLAREFGNVPITGHNEYANKGCPGFQVSKWLEVSPVGQPKPSLIATLIDLLTSLIKGKT